MWYHMHTERIHTTGKKVTSMNRKLFDFIAASPTAFHCVATTADILQKAGYTALSESEDWALLPGKGYYATRNGSSIIAFRMPDGDFDSFMIAAAHGDAPTFRIKENAELTDQNYVRLSTEKYGGMLCATWMDRPLGVAGRVTVRTSEGMETRLVDLGIDADGRRVTNAVIPSVAIHMNRSANDNASYNPATDMLPLAGMAADTPKLRERIAEALGVCVGDILTADLALYNPAPGVEWNGMISAPRLDDQQCAYSVLSGFLAAADTQTASLPVMCIFDNEEVGSTTRQGAASTFLADVLARIGETLNLSGSALRRKISSGFMLSCDNGHAVHPNHPEFSDRNHTVRPNGGVVIKYNAAQKYTSDAVSAALFRMICEKAGVPYQLYANRADMAGGSTLGNISTTQVPLCTVDIGLAQLAMHSSFETGGAKDTGYMVSALTTFFASTVRMEKDGQYRLS